MEFILFINFKISCFFLIMVLGLMPHKLINQFINMLPQDQLRLIGCLLFAIPTSYWMSTINNPSKLLTITCLVSILLHSYLFGYEALALWFQQHLVYFICKYGPRRKVGRIVFVETFIFLIIIQVRRMILSYGQQNYDLTAILMMQVFMYVGFAYNYQDGIDEKQKQSQRTIHTLPPYKQYLGFILFVPASMVGPVFQFQDFHNYIYRTGIYKDLKPGFTIPAIKKQLIFFIKTFAVFILSSPLKISYMITPEFAQLNFFYQSIYLLISVMAARFKYYSAWSLGMLSMHASGITHNPKYNEEGEIEENGWDRVVVSDVWTFEMDPSMKKKADGWNISVQLALKRYVYDRIYQPGPQLSPKQKKKLQIISQQKTLAVSAFWHGLYPGYFVSFFHWALLLQISQELFRIQRESSKFAEIRKKLHYVELIFINYFLGVFGTCFLLMSWQKIYLFFSAIKFIPVVITYIGNLLIVRLALFTPKKSKKTEDKVQ